VLFRPLSVSGLDAPPNNRQESDLKITATGFAALLLVALGLNACGSKGADPAGPDVVGMTLPDAKTKLHKVGVQTTVHTDAMFGVLIPSHFIVCEEVPVNKRMVRLEVEKEC
jgi:hypothetical protein